MIKLWIMKAIILLGTLKQDKQSNTAVLTEFCISYLEKQGIECEVIRLVDCNISPGTYTDMGTGDDWPAIFDKIVAANILIFATPIWWNSHSSEIQRIIERLDEVYHMIIEGKESPLDGIFGGMIISGNDDGAESITGHIANFFTSIGITVPAYCSVGVLYEGHDKNKILPKQELLDHYEKEYGSAAEAMAKQFAKLVRATS
jgi:multimeric flavodoxin WrbA